jgi:hypothetical protein
LAEEYGERDWFGWFFGEYGDTQGMVIVDCR